jgi:UDP:flavonoid glycosyltransferase YjiC (YdhE family)
MSNFLFITNPSVGHMYPMYPIASELVKSGHIVKWISGWAFKEKVEKTGAEYIQMHPKYDRGTTDLYEFFPELKKLKGIAMVKFYWKYWIFSPVPYYIKQIENLLQDYKADAIIGETFRSCAVFVTERGGPPFAMINVFPLIYPSKDVPPQGIGMLPGQSFISKIKESILRFVLYKIVYRSNQNYCNHIRSDLGLPKYKRFALLELWERPEVVCQPTVPFLEFPRTKLPPNVHFIGPILIKPDPDFVPPPWWDKIISGNKKVILINQGTIAKTIDNLIKPSIETLKNENVIVIAVPVKKNQLNNLPPNTFVSEFIPFGNLLPHVDLVITNGGYGGVQNALAHGIPLIIAGQTEDKMEVSARVEYAQVGIDLKTSNPSPDNILQAVHEVFSNPLYRKNAENYQSESKKYNAPQMAVSLLEKMVRKS